MNNIATLVIVGLVIIFGIGYPVTMHFSIPIGWGALMFLSLAMVVMYHLSKYFSNSEDFS